MPRAKPAHHVLVDDDLYAPGKVWYNVDKFAGDGVDECLDLFTYPWPWEDNRFGGVLLSHIVEHIPHEIRIQATKRTPHPFNGDDPPHWAGPVQDNHSHLQQLGDGFYVFFSELWRVCEPGAVAHILAPYGMSFGALVDPTHTRALMPATFHYLQPDPNAPFEKEYGSHWAFEGDSGYAFHSDYRGATGAMVNYSVEHYWGVITDFYVRLKAVKDGRDD